MATTKHSSPLEILKESNRRVRESAERTPLDMLRNRRLLLEKRVTRRNLIQFIAPNDEPRR